MVWLEMKELAYFLWYGMVWYGFPTDGKERGTCQLWTFFVLTQHVGGEARGWWWIGKDENTGEDVDRRGLKWLKLAFK